MGSAERDVFLLDGRVPRAAGAFRGRDDARGYSERGTLDDRRRAEDREAREKETRVASMRTPPVREREVRMVAGSSGGIQIHVDAAQSGVHHFSTHSHPLSRSLPPTHSLTPSSAPSSAPSSSHHPTPISYRPPDSPFDTGSGVPIDLDRLKTRRNHRRQLLRTPLSGMSCGRIGVGEILAREAFCRSDVGGCLKQCSITKSRSERKTR